MKLAINSLFLFCTAFLTPLNSHESTILSNIEQLTFPDMGFEKAGEAYFSPDGATILFQAVPKGEKQYQIYSMVLHERIPRMVSTGKGACTCAFFHPNGKKIIFASSHEDPYLYEAVDTPGYKRDGKEYSWQFTPWMNIYEANQDGSGLTRITDGPSYHAECAYSPDGKSIVFASNEDGFMNLYILNMETREQKKITENSHCYIGGPFFSPSGNEIIYRKDPEKKNYLDVYLIAKDGSYEKKITNNGAINWAPYWHPNGKVIAYTTSLHGHHQYQIYLQDLETGKEVQVTSYPVFNGLPVFHPDGTKIMWTSKRGPDGTCQIFLADFHMPEAFQ